MVPLEAVFEPEFLRSQRAAKCQVFSLRSSTLIRVAWALAVAEAMAFPCKSRKSWRRDWCRYPLFR